MTTQTMPTTNVQTIQAIYDAFGRGDVAAILARVTEDVSWDNSRVASRECPWNGDFSGKNRLPGFFQAVGEQLDITVFEPRNFIASGNQVAVLLRLESTLRKNGKPFVNDVMHLWSFDDRGLVTTYRHFNDTALELAAWRG